jgi:hypothetical protein
MADPVAKINFNQPGISAAMVNSGANKGRASPIQK